MFEEEDPRPKGEIVLGEDLYDFSIGDLNERVAFLQAEITRVQKALEEKRSGLDAASAIFGKS